MVRDARALRAGSDSDSQNNRVPVTELGSGPAAVSRIQIAGDVTVDPPVPELADPEDDGSIPAATPVALLPGSAARFDGTIGDGPFGSSAQGPSFSGDVDFFRLAGVVAGQRIFVDVTTPVGSSLDSFVGLWTAGGVLFAINDDQTAGVQTDSFLEVVAPISGDFYVSVAGFGTFITSNPFDSSTGLGPGSEGDYAVAIGIDYFASEVFELTLRQGDVLGASVTGGARTIGLLDGQSNVLTRGSNDISALFPIESPLPGGGNATVARVIEQTASYLVVIDGSEGEYQLTLTAHRPGPADREEGGYQRVFLDFDGATVNGPELFFGQGNPNAVLSPMSAFLANWGLSADDEDALIDGILAVVEESVAADAAELGNNGSFDVTGIPGQHRVEIFNSRDHVDPGDDPSVSRVVVGGTVSELMIGTIGIASSIDPGNFGAQETAVVLLDTLSLGPSIPNSLNSIPLGPDADKLELVARGVGNIVAHEIGHYTGNFHTEQFVSAPNIMDRGGNLPNNLGVGPDGVFGTDDDIDVDFGVDIYDPAEFYLGFQDTLNTLAFGHSTSERDTVVIKGCDSRAPNLVLNDASTFSDAIGACADTSARQNKRGRGPFVSCVAHEVRTWIADALLHPAEARGIRSCAARSGL